jgi:tetratricopeptide (TPR) repeat protein
VSGSAEPGSNVRAALRQAAAPTSDRANRADTHYQRGIATGNAGSGQAEVVKLRRALALNPELPGAWLALADHLRGIGDLVGADTAYARHIKCSTRDPRLLAAGAALYKNQIPVAEALLRTHLTEFPTDVAAIRMFSEVAVRVGRLKDAENLLIRCLELAPHFAGARHNYASVLHRLNKPIEALREIERLLESDPHNPSHRNLKGAILTRIGEYDEAIEIYSGVLSEYPMQAKVWMNYGHALKTAGRESESVNAYRKCIELEAGCGEAYWSLANLKTFRFERAEMDAMRAQLERTDLSDENRFHFQFAMGKALEDARDFGPSFQYYANGNRLRRTLLPYNAGELATLVRHSKAVLDKEFFAHRAGYGASAADPIFIIGLPRSGSTLVEQILASHSAVEGTMELADLIQISQELRTKGTNASPLAYPQLLASLSAEDCRVVGERYLQQTRIQRKTCAPFFIDKMPNNFAHIGLIRLALPNAKIIDTRRHPLGCCVSAFKQHFARGQAFTYDLEDLGRYFSNYVELMSHFDEVLPDAIHRVTYEELVNDTEREVRRLLAYCGLAFEERCLRFYENTRAVRTASSQQVRQPIFRDGMERWRDYEPWLQPLKQALGSVLDAYPSAPKF